MFGQMRTTRTTSAVALRNGVIALSAAVVLTCFGSAGPGVAATVVASWEFTQVAGVVPDLQTGTHNLKLSNPWSSVEGPAGDPSAIRFNAAPAAATTAGHDFNPGTGSFALTVQLRATKDVTSGSPNVAQHGGFDDPGQIKMQLAAGGKVGCRIKGDRGAYLFFHKTATVNDNQWHSVTCARNATDVSVTVDGVVFSPAGTENPGAIVVRQVPLRFAQKPGSTSKADQFIGDISFASYST